MSRKVTMQEFGALEDRVALLEKESRQAKCEHRFVDFVGHKAWGDLRKECANCGKILEYYHTDEEVEVARLACLENAVENQKKKVAAQKKYAPKKKGKK